MNIFESQKALIEIRERIKSLNNAVDKLMEQDIEPDTPSKITQDERKGTKEKTSPEKTAYNTTPSIDEEEWWPTDKLPGCNAYDGARVILKERTEQVTKHGYTLISDIIENNHGQLQQAARMICLIDTDSVRSKQPHGWSEELWNRMILKPYKDRLKIAGAFLAAEYDRLSCLERISELMEKDEISNS